VLSEPRSDQLCEECYTAEIKLSKWGKNTVPMTVKRALGSNLTGHNPSFTKERSTSRLRKPDLRHTLTL
jgi:hypothetical protein